MKFQTKTHETCISAISLLIQWHLTIVQ